MALLAYIISILSFTILLLTLFVFNPSLNTSFIVWQGQGIKLESCNSAVVSEIASIIQLA